MCVGLDQPFRWIKNRKSASRFLYSREEVVSQASNQCEARGKLEVVHREAADDVLLDVGPIASYPVDARHAIPRRWSPCD